MWKRKTNISFPIIGIAIILMISGWVVESTGYDVPLGQVLFTIGFWLLVIPLLIICGILLLVVLITK